MIMSMVGWARVSTKDQSLEQQESRLKEAGCIKIFSSKHSGKAESNIDKLEEMLDYVREGDTLLVQKLDRLGRSLSQVLNAVDRLTEKGVGLKALDQPIDTSNDDAMGKAMMQLLGMFAEMERNMIVERTTAGRKATGNYGGRPKSYTEEQEKEIVKKMMEGASDKALWTEYGISRATMAKIRKANGIKPIRPA
jgi:DNA invertase Pin-like site-specific DNA recombinase